MSRLVDTIDINVGIERAWEWFGRLPETYAAWSPDHLGFEADEGYVEGARVRWRRLIAGRAYETEGRIVFLEHSAAGFRIETVSDGGFVSYHVVCVPLSDTSCRLTRAEEFGLPETCGAGRAANFVLLDLCGGSRAMEREVLDALRRDNAYLKCILEYGICPVPATKAEPAGAPVPRSPMTWAALQAAGKVLVGACALALAFRFGSKMRKG